MDKGFKINWAKFGKDVKSGMRTRFYSYRSLGKHLGVNKQVFVKIGKGEGCETGLFLTLCVMLGYNPAQYLEIAVEVPRSLFPEVW